jgi:hypothetical protein
MYEDHSPIFTDENDPYSIRFKVTPLVVLEMEHAIPVTDPSVWTSLSWTRGRGRGRGWGMIFRRALREFEPADGQFLATSIRRQAQTPTVYPLSDSDKRHLRARPRVQTTAGTIAVEVPDSSDEQRDEGETAPAVTRESIKMQALLCEIGVRMGFRVWLPPADRERVLELLDGDLRSSAIERLPLNYDEATLRTVEQIDVLWLRGRSIVRAFEVEHTTAIYSGLLRMADLLALQPNMQIALHIVAPDEKREKVLREIQRPVFALLDRGPLAETCSFLSYASIREIAGNPTLAHLRDTILDDFEEYAETE